MVSFIVGLVIGCLAGFFIGGVYSADDKFFGDEEAPNCSDCPFGPCEECVFDKEDGYV